MTLNAQEMMFCRPCTFNSFTTICYYCFCWLDFCNTRMILTILMRFSHNTVADSPYSCFVKSILIISLLHVLNCEKFSLTTHHVNRASERCQQEKRKTINGEDILFAMTTLGFDNYIEPLKVYLTKYREVWMLFIYYSYVL